MLRPRFALILASSLLGAAGAWLGCGGDDSSGGSSPDAGDADTASPPFEAGPPPDAAAINCDNYCDAVMLE
jgi:hypothetical protein